MPLLLMQRASCAAVGAFQPPAISSQQLRRSETFGVLHLDGHYDTLASAMKFASVRLDRV